MSVDDLSTNGPIIVDGGSESSQFMVRRALAGPWIGLQIHLRPYTLVTASQCVVVQNTTAVAVHLRATEHFPRHLPFTSNGRSRSLQRRYHSARPCRVKTDQTALTMVCLRFVDFNSDTRAEPRLRRRTFHQLPTLESALVDDS